MSCPGKIKLKELFPVEVGPESNLGVPVHGRSGQEILEHLAVLDDRPLQPDSHRASITQIEYWPHHRRRAHAAEPLSFSLRQFKGLSYTLEHSASKSLKCGSGQM